MRQPCFTVQVTPAGSPRDPYDVPIVRHRWVFVASVVTWVTFVAIEVLVIIYNLVTGTGFDAIFWVGPVMVVFMATILIRARRLRRVAALQAHFRH